MSQEDFASRATMAFNGEKNSVISNIRDNFQISLLAPKYKRARAAFLIHHFQCHINEKFNVEVVETAKIGFSVKKQTKQCHIMQLQQRFISAS